MIASVTKFMLGRTKYLNKNANVMGMHFAHTLRAVSLFYNPLNSECISGIGRSYLGERSVTQTGHICQEWISNSPHSHDNHNLASFSDRDTVSTLAEVRNYCRNPDGEPEGPWCYGLTGNRWAYCGIPQCQLGLKKYT